MESFLSIITTVPVVLPIALLLVSPILILALVFMFPVLRHEEKKHPEVPHGIKSSPRELPV